MQLKASTDFLRQAHPLKHVAPVRKSQVQHALCEVLAAMLAGNVKADLPRYAYLPLHLASATGTSRSERLLEKQSSFGVFWQEYGVHMPGAWSNSD